MQTAVPDEEGNGGPQGARMEPKGEMMDMSDLAFVVTDVRAKQELKEVGDMCTQAQRIITSNPRDAN